MTEPAPPPLTLDRFHNALRIMLGIDYAELRGVGIEMNGAGWQAFSSNPFRWFIRAGEDDARKVWSIIEGRQVP